MSVNFLVHVDNAGGVNADALLDANGAQLDNATVTISSCFDIEDYEVIFAPTRVIKSVRLRKVFYYGILPARILDFINGH